MYKPRIPVPAIWPQLAVLAVLEAIALAHWGMVWIESWCVNSRIERVRLKGENARLEED